jgi:di/tricarboxylate transporter
MDHCLCVQAAFIFYSCLTLKGLTVLAMGGIALGKAVDSSGLLVIADELVRELIQGLSLYSVVLVLSVVVMVRPQSSR